MSIESDAGDDAPSLEQRIAALELRVAELESICERRYEWLEQANDRRYSDTNEWRRTVYDAVCELRGEIDRVRQTADRTERGGRIF